MTTKRIGLREYFQDQRAAAQAAAAVPAPSAPPLAPPPMFRVAPRTSGRPLQSIEDLTAADVQAIVVDALNPDAWLLYIVDDVNQRIATPPSLSAVVERLASLGMWRYGCRPFDELVAEVALAQPVAVPTFEPQRHLRLERAAEMARMATWFAPKRCGRRGEP